MTVFRMAMTAAVPRKADGRPDFDPYEFRRRLSEVFSAPESDILLNISIVVLARNQRVLESVAQTADVRITPLDPRSIAHMCC